MKYISLIFLIIASSASAQQRLTGKEFDARSRGTTMYFTENGQFYGAEQFFPGRRTVWRAEDGTCVNGKWTEINGDICFFYDNGDGPHCWRIVEEDAGLTVTSTRSNDGLPPVALELSGQDTTPILCTGPLFGV